MAELLDQYGKAIPADVIASLREEISAPLAIAGRPPFAGHIAFGMNPAQLGAIVAAADQGNSLEFYTLAEEVEELFTHYQSVLSKRRRQVAQLPMSVEAADGGGAFDQHADFVRQWIDRDVLAGAMFDVTDAVGKGYSVCELLWEQRPGYCAPREMKWRTQRFFELDYTDGETLLMRTAAGLVPLQPLKFLVHTHKSKSGNVVRGGLTRMAMFLWLYSSYTQKDWAVFVQAYGFPIRVGKYGPEASDNDRRVLWRAVSSIAGDMAAIIAKSMEIEFVKDSDRSAGSELYLNRADWLNREVSKLVLGSTAGTEALKGGHAVGREHRQVEDDIEKFDAALLATSLTRQVLQPMVMLTFGPQDAYPVLRIGRQDRAPMNDMIAGVVSMVPLGLKVRKDEVMEWLQLTPPEEGDDVLEAPVAPAAPPQKPFAAPEPEMQSQRPLLNRLLLHSEISPEAMDHLTARVAADAQGALQGMTEQVRDVFDTATSLHDLADRLSKLKLDPAEFAAAMQRGLALAELIGEAALIDELRGRASPVH